MARKKKEEVPTGTDMLREMQAATLAAETEITHAAADERNTVITEVGVRDTAIESIESCATHTEGNAGADLTGLDDILDHKFGRNTSGRFVYALNFEAQRYVRSLLKAEVEDQAKDPAEKAAEQEINDYFGFGATPQDEYGVDLPVVTLADAIHWQIVTWMYVRDLSHYTESDERGMKSKPYGWMEKVVRNPLAMLYSDARYGQSRQVDQQVVNAVKLGMHADLIEEVQNKYDFETKMVSESRVEDKVIVLKAFMRPSEDYRMLETDDHKQAIVDMVTALGIKVPLYMADVAAGYKDKAIMRALEGKYIGDVDEELLRFIPEHTMTRIGKSHEEKLAEAKAKHADNRRLLDEDIAQDKKKQTPEAQAEIRRNVKRVTREQYEQQNAMKSAFGKAAQHTH